MINFRNHKFIKSAADHKGMLYDYNQVLMVGRSNVGKSTLINSLVGNSSFAKVSATPGKTKLINYFLIDEKFYLVDAPGYGYTSDGGLDFSSLMDQYFDNNRRLKLVLWLLDSRRELNVEDEMFREQLSALNVPIIVVFTKVDKLNQSEKAKLKRFHEEEFKNFDKVLCSSKDNTLIELLQSKISSKI